jgi:hypothetical protein
LTSPNERDVEIVGLPVFTTDNEVKETLQDATEVHPMYYGKSPGFSYTCLTNPNYPKTVITNFFLDQIPSTTSIPALPIIRNIFSGDPATLGQYDILARFSNNHRIWIPAFLQHLFYSATFSDLLQNDAWKVSRALSNLRAIKYNSGEDWERVVNCALLL